MARRSSPIVRNQARFQPQARILVITEDSKSGKLYLQDANQYFRANLRIEIIHSGYTDPVGIVTQAIRRAKEYDEVICAIDRDTHANFDQALRLAQHAPKVKILASYPCFEYWLLLHFSESRKPYAAAGGKSPAQCLIEDLCNCPGMNDYSKGNPRGLFDRLLGEPFDTARRRAPRILADARASRDMNPSTELHLLIDIMERQSVPKGIAS